MTELKSVIFVIEIIIAALLVMLLGDYLGYKVGRWRLAVAVGIVALVSIVAFAIYAAVRLA